MTVFIDRDELLRQLADARGKALSFPAPPAHRDLAIELVRQVETLVNALPVRELEPWGSDCVLDGGCGGNATHDSMRCDSCGSTRHTVPLFTEDKR